LPSIRFFPDVSRRACRKISAFSQQVAFKKPFDISILNYGLSRIIIGLTRKLIIADNLGKFIMQVLIAPELNKRFIIIAAVYGLAIEIYMDFAGYTDIALGVSGLFGIKIMENFNKPLLKTNIASFWRSWHISVYSWIRDYFFCLFLVIKHQNQSFMWVFL